MSVLVDYTSNDLNVLQINETSDEDLKGRVIRDVINEDLIKYDQPPRFSGKKPKKSDKDWAKSGWQNAKIDTTVD